MKAEVGKLYLQVSAVMISEEGKEFLNDSDKKDIGVLFRVEGIIGGLYHRQPVRKPQMWEVKLNYVEPERRYAGDCLPSCGEWYFNRNFVPATAAHLRQAARKALS